MSLTEKLAATLGLLIFVFLGAGVVAGPVCDSRLWTGVFLILAALAAAGVFVILFIAIWSS